MRARAHRIEQPGYTQEDRVAIARRYLVNRQHEACGLREDQVVLADDVVAAVVSRYTREPGVRQLEREIGRLMRHADRDRCDAARRDPRPAALRARDGAAQRAARRGDRMGVGQVDDALREALTEAPAPRSLQLA
jgi:ATP-dependent Lon protease